MSLNATSAVRRGLTLTELLVVIAILAILSAVLIPLVNPMFANRKTREAARQVNVYFAAAQARAAELQRPVGVWIERRNSAPGEAFQLFMAETPPPYVGDFTGTRVWIREDDEDIDPVAPGKQPNLAIQYAVFNQPDPSIPANFTSQLLTTAGFVHLGDRIKFDYRGPAYRVVATSSMFMAPANQVTPDVHTFAIARPIEQSSVPWPPDSMFFDSGTSSWTIVTPGVPYQMYRSEQRSGLTSLELPGSTVIDLTVSGMGASGFQFTPGAGPVVILFSPTGGIESVRVGGGLLRPTGPVHLLVGDTEKVNVANPTNPNANLNDLSNLWVSINHRSGAISTTEVVDSSTVVGPLLNRLPVARQFARLGDSMEGN